MQVTVHLSDPGWGLEPPQGPGGPPLTFFNVDGGRSRISVRTHHRGPSSTFPNVDGGRSRISSSDTSQGASHRYFLALVVGAPVSPAPALPREPVVDVS
jgi:hypothetical protein